MPKHLLLQGVLLVLAAGGLSACARKPSGEKEVSGQQLYEKNCALCHGKTGDGLGEAAFLLQPKPRRFRAGKFRLVSSQNGQPTREDLLRTITNGMPGTAMPSWAHLPESERKALVDYVLELDREGWIERGREQGMSAPEAASFAAEMMDPGAPIVVPPEPPDDAASLAQGEKLYRTNCSRCHGDTGEGRPDPTWRTAEGFPVPSRDLGAGIFKGGRQGRDLYLRLATGLPGSPMPAAEVAGEDLWHIVHWVQSLSDPQAQERATVRVKDLRAVALAKLPTGPEDPAWEQASPVEVPLMPLWWRRDLAHSVSVRAAHDGASLAFLLEWEDPTQDTVITAQKSFPDGAAVELSAASDPPLFAMGAGGAVVNIWHWKAVWDKDLKAFQDITSAFPHLSPDLYYGREKGWRAGPREDPLYVPAERLGNPVAWKERPSNVEDDNAAGLGTLTPQRAANQDVHGLARWEGGHWRLQIWRDLAGDSPRDVPLRAGSPLSVAFALWDGSHGDRDGQKVVSIWNHLSIDEGKGQ